MSIAIRVSDQLMKKARVISAVENRSITGQIEYWAKIGKCAEENPGLSFNFIKEILVGMEELAEGMGTEYKFS
ncbi:MAG: ParD-like family protein [Candidatus Aminicenantes bacterium]|nr:ParD-like family protein [Candidatus Aminicenantes bacterium]